MRPAYMASLALALVAITLRMSPVLAQENAKPESLKVAIGQINNWENQPPTLGQEAGIFKKHGLVLETFGTAGAGETLQPIIAGSADIGIGVGVAGVMRAFSTGAPVRIVTRLHRHRRPVLVCPRQFAAKKPRRCHRAQHHCVFHQRLEFAQSGARLRG